MEFFPNVNFPLIYPKILSFSIRLYSWNDKVGMEWHTHWISLTILLLKLPCLFVQCFVFMDFWIYTFLLMSNHISWTKKATGNSSKIIFWISVFLYFVKFHISGTERAIRDPWVPKQPDLSGLFRFPKKWIVWISGLLYLCISLDFWPYIGNEKELLGIRWCHNDRIFEGFSDFPKKWIFFGLLDFWISGFL